MHTNGTHKNNDNTTMPMLIGLNKTTRNTDAQKKNSAGKDKELCSQTNIFQREQRKFKSIKII
jgi:hypothetical protein